MSTSVPIRVPPQRQDISLFQDINIVAKKGIQKRRKIKLSGNKENGKVVSNKPLGPLLSMLNNPTEREKGGRVEN